MMAFGDRNGKVGGFGPKGNNANSSRTPGFGASKPAGTFGFGSSAKKNESANVGQNNTNKDFPMLFRSDIRDDEKASHIKRTRVVTFTNVHWTKFDNIIIHPSGAQYNEPHVHVIANQESIEFHGYNVSAMDEGVYYKIGQNDDFEIECNVDTTKIQEHPGGDFYISFGIISAKITHKGGSFLLNNRIIAQVGTKFNMKLSLKEAGKFEVYIDGKKRGEEFKATTSEIKIIFGFEHDEHNCAELSHAYLNKIKMKQSKSSEGAGFGCGTSSSTNFGKSFRR